MQRDSIEEAREGKVRDGRRARKKDRGGEQEEEDKERKMEKEWLEIFCQ